MAGAAALIAGLLAREVVDSPRVAALTLDDRFIAYGNGGDGFSTFAGGNPRVVFFDRGVFAQGTTVGVQGDGVGGNGPGVIGNSTNSHGVIGNGYSDTSAGLFGNGNGANGTGVFGYGNGSGSGVFGGGGLYGVKGIVGNSGYGVHGTAGIGYGVYGTAPSGIGVGGDSGNVGVMGRGGGDTSGNLTGFPIGVRGSIPDDGYAVYGAAGNGYGVYGRVTSGIGVGGVATGVGSGVRGVGISGIGVLGASTSSAGVFGTSTSGYGVLASVQAGGVAALYGYSYTANVPAFYAVNYAAPSPPNSNAGFFIGQVYINGPFIVAGGPKSAAVPHPDGSHRLLYCVESPESWFEDFGEGTITAGKAEVKLDPDFAAVVDTAKLHVFCMPHNASHHLAVTTRAGGSFSVEADVSGTAAARGVKASDVSGTFTYRVVAKRKDVVAPRLAKFDLPKPLPAPPTPPTVPEKKPKA